MKNRKVLFLLLPLLVVSCNTVQSSSGGQGSSEQQQGSVIDIEDNDEYDAWLDSWSQPGHLYFHYNRGDKGGYDNYCLWLWQHSPQDLEGSLWGFSADPKVSDKLTLQPMSNHWMTAKEVGKDGDEMYLDTYGVIADVDLYAANLVGGKTGKPTTFEGMEDHQRVAPAHHGAGGDGSRCRLAHWFRHVRRRPDGPRA